MDNRAESKKALVLKAFNTLFKKWDYDAAETFWSPAIQPARKATSTMTIPNSVEVNGGCRCKPNSEQLFKVSMVLRRKF